MWHKPLDTFARETVLLLALICILGTVTFCETIGGGIRNRTLVKCNYLDLKAWLLQQIVNLGLIPERCLRLGDCVYFRALKAF